MTTSKLNLIAALTGTASATLAYTVAELARTTGLSESRVREIIKTLDDVQTVAGKPARFFIAASTSVGFELTETEFDPAGADPETDDEVTGEKCPLCGGHSSSQTGAGPEGTFLGDSCNVCHECGKTYNRHTGEEIAEAAGKGRKGPLNPQPKIDAKTATVEAAGGTLTYASRKWTVAKGNKSHTMTSQEFSTFTGEELLALVK